MIKVGVDWMADTSPARGPSPQLQVQQSPPESSIPDVSPSVRSVFFAIIHSETVPEQVVVRGKADGKDVPFRVDVESMTFGRQLPSRPSTHSRP
jgi:hypothetical protein